MTDITLTDGTITVTIQGKKVDWDLSKDWKINKIPTTASGWANTTLSSNASSGASSIVVTNSTSFAVNDKITITGYDGSSVRHADEQTISSITPTTPPAATFALKGTLGASYVTAGSAVIREGRTISLDFNQIVESLTIAGLITASGSKDVVGVCLDLMALSKKGGSISVSYGPYKFSEMAVTKISITETVEDQGSGTNPSQYDVILNLTYSGKPIGT